MIGRNVQRSKSVGDIPAIYFKDATFFIIVSFCYCFVSRVIYYCCNKMLEGQEEVEFEVSSWMKDRRFIVVSVHRRRTTEENGAPCS